MFYNLTTLCGFLLRHHQRCLLLEPYTKGSHLCHFTPVCHAGTAGREYECLLYPIRYRSLPPSYFFFGCLKSYINFTMSSILPDKPFSPHGRHPTAPAFWIPFKPPLWSTKSNPVPSQLYPLPPAKDQMRQKAPLLAMFAIQPQLCLSRACQAPKKEVGQLQGYQ